MDTFTVTEDDFQTNLTVLDILDGTTTSISPQYCATTAAAQRLLAHLATLGLHPTLTSDFPSPGWPEGSPFVQSAKVPYFDFVNATTGAVDHENVGGILDEYMVFGQRLIDYRCTNNWFTGDN